MRTIEINGCPFTNAIAAQEELHFLYPKEQRITLRLLNDSGDAITATVDTDGSYKLEMPKGVWFVPSNTTETMQFIMLAGVVALKNRA